MGTLIVGSVAAMARCPGWEREPRDIDLFSNDSAPQQYGHDVYWHDSFSEWIPDNEARVATLDELYTIKVSHAYWELHGTWDKHMSDLLTLKRAGAQLIPWLHDLLYPVWADMHGKKTISLDQEADEFFTDAVTRVYVHDSIHESVAHYDRPLYETVLKDGASVNMDMAKVWAMPFEDQIKMFREEVYVTALERLIIPNDYNYSAGRAYHWALRRTITRLTKGRSALFMVDNFEYFSKPQIDYVALHLSNSDKLIPLEGNT